MILTKAFLTQKIIHRLHILLVTTIGLLIMGCSRGEPPLSMEDGKPGSLARKTKLVARDSGPASLKPGNDFLKYEIIYPNQGLTSIATAGLMFGSLREEVFQKKWLVKYIYQGKWEGRDWHEAYGIPLSIEIYGYSGGSYDTPINTYRLSKLVTNYPIYTDLSGKEKTISTTYFSVSSGLQ